ncbi:MAG: type II secretion system protein [Phycisphaerae bacterium]
MRAIDGKTRPVVSAGFTLIELLVVIAIIALLMSILMPALGRARQMARGVKCLTNLHNLGVAMAQYHSDNRDYFWACADEEFQVYFWGENADPVDTDASAFMGHVGDPQNLLCPEMPWGTYVPEGAVNEPTTTYGYNAWSLDPAFWYRTGENGEVLPRKRSTQVPRPSELFVLADSAVYNTWTAGGVLQNTCSLDPPQLPWGANDYPTTHFRHDGRAHALCADGHAADFGIGDGRMVMPQHNLGFVGDENAPHYDQ